VTVARRIATSTALLILLLVGALGYHLIVVRRLVAAGREIATDRMQLMVATLGELSLLEGIDESSRKLVATGDDGYARQLAERVERFRSGLAQISGFELASAERTALASLGSDWSRFLAALPELRRAASLSDPEARRQPLAASQTLLAALRRDAQALVGVANDELDRQSRLTEQARRDSERLALVVFAVALLLGVAAVVLAVRAIQRPLRQLVAATGQVADENYSFQLAPLGGDEFARLGAAFNAMVRRLGELDLMKRNLLSHVSHELQTPLANIQESQLLLLDGLPGPLTAEQRHLLELNVGSCSRLSRLISNLLERSRLDAGIIAFDRATYDVREIADSIAAEFAARASDAGILLSSELAARPLRSVCDRERIAQVLHNLVDNAVKYSLTGGKVVIRAEAVDGPPADLPDGQRELAESAAGYVLIEVSDEGIGIPAEERQRIFVRFYRSIRRPGGPPGVGLGLAICRDIVAAHGGAIWVTPNHPQGSRFRVLLPAEPAPVEETESDDARVAPSDWRVVSPRTRGPIGLVRSVLFGALALGLCAATSGCSVSAARRDADRRFLAGDAAAAAVAYDSILVSPGFQPHEDELLFRAATAHAVASPGLDDLVRSRTLLHRLVSEHPGSDYRPAAELLLRLYDELLVERRARVDMQESSTRLRDDAESSTERLGSVEGELERLRQTLAQLHRQIDQMRGDTAAREEQVRQLREEIDRIKAIDLEQKPATAPPP